MIKQQNNGQFLQSRDMVICPTGSQTLSACQGFPVLPTFVETIARCTNCQQCTLQFYSKQAVTTSELCMKFCGSLIYACSSLLSDLTKMAEMNLGAVVLCFVMISGTFLTSLTPRSLPIVVPRMSFHHSQKPYQQIKSTQSHNLWHLKTAKIIDFS